jgi:YD repeat-containing protein
VEEGWRPPGHDVIVYLNGVTQSTRNIRRQADQSPLGGTDLSILDATRRTTALHYDQMGRHVQTTFPVGVAQTNTFDGDGRLLHTSFTRSAVNGTLGMDVTYDIPGRLASRTSSSGDSRWSYGYDSAGRLVSHEASRVQAPFGCDPSIEECSEPAARSRRCQPGSGMGCAT